MALEAQCRHVRNRLRLVVAFSRSEIFLQTSEPDGCAQADRDGTQTSDRPVIERSRLDNQRSCGNRKPEESAQSTERWTTACVACQDQSVEKRHHRAATIG